MQIRDAGPADAEAVQAIYAPVVRDTAISFELEPPTVEEMRGRIVATTGSLPWLVAVDDAGAVIGYAYAGRHRERAAYQWSVDVSAYVHADHRGRGVGKALYERMFDLLAAAGYCQAFAGIALPNVASVALHESIGFAPLGVYRNVGFKNGAWRDVGWWQKEIQLPPCPETPKQTIADVRAEER
jgi:L-amino acid N-acyltransferase YncA